MHSGRPLFSDIFSEDSERPLGSLLEYKVIQGDKKPPASPGRRAVTYDTPGARVQCVETPQGLKAFFPSSFYRDPEIHVRVDCRRKEVRVHSTAGAASPLSPVTFPVLLPFLFSREKAGVFLHASSLKIGSDGYLFVGPSGAGKSTMVTLFDQYAKTHQRPDIRVVNDETNIVTPSGLLFGAPWSGSAGFAEKGSVPLKAVFFHHKGETDRIIPAGTKAAYVRYLQCAKMAHVMPSVSDYYRNFVFDLIRKIPHFNFEFGKTPSAIQFFLEMRAKEWHG